MGASLNCVSFASDAKDKIKESWDSMVQDSLWEDGHSYSGGIGMLAGPINWRDMRLESSAAAEDYISERHAKWDGPMSVSYAKGDKSGWIIGGWCSE